MKTFAQYLDEASSELLHWYLTQAASEAAHEPPEGKRRVGMKKAVEWVIGQGHYKPKYTKAGRKLVKRLKKKK